MNEQSAFINDFDVDQLLSESPLINESSNTSGSNEHIFDLEIIQDDPELNLGILFPGNIGTNTFDDISTFAGILSPLGEKEFSVHTASTSPSDAMDSPCLSDSSFSSIPPPALLTTQTIYNTGMITPEDGRRINNSKTAIKLKEKLQKLNHKTVVSPKKKTISSDASKDDRNSDDDVGSISASSSTTSTTSSASRVPHIITSIGKSYVKKNDTGRTHNLNNILTLNSKSPKFKFHQSTNGKLSPIMKASQVNNHLDGVSSYRSTSATRTGRWSPEEHLLFLRGIAQHGRHWEKVAKGVATRTTVQVRSHAQKYFKKLVKKERADDSTYTSTSRSGKTSPSYELSDATIMRNAAYELHELTTEL
jgi:SHAQKYF class myb-like DNA-binding protein